MKKILPLFIALALAICTASKPQKIVILGDSYSTFEGCIPEGYANWYWVGEGGNDVHSADSTWWSHLQRRTGVDILLNSSYSGATICNIGYRGEDYTDRSFVTRAKTDIVREDGKAGRCGEIPDAVLIFGGTNDCWAKSPRGKVVDPAEWRSANLNECFPATSYLLGYLKEKLPAETRVIVIVNTELGEEFETSFAEACKLYGAECVQLKDIHKIRNHPSQLGMRQIADQLEPILKN